MIFFINNLNNNDRIEVSVHHDICGNIFLKHNQSYYCLTINQNDDIEFTEFVNFKPDEKQSDKSNKSNKFSLNYSNIINTYEKQSLKGKLIKELDDQNYDEDEDEIENEGRYITKYKSYPEEKLYVTDKSNQSNQPNDNSELNDEYVDEYYEPHYKFAKFGEKAMIPCLNDSLDDLAIYDTFVLNENTSCIHLTLQSEEKSSYRISILTNGTFILNIVGTKIKMFKLHYLINDQNETEIKTTNTKTSFV